MSETQIMAMRVRSSSALVRLTDDAGYMARGAYPAKVSDLQDIAADIQSVLAMYAELRDALAKIADGSTPPQPHGHYLAHRHAVKIAREALAHHTTSPPDQV
jgi:hypothetical protein